MASLGQINANFNANIKPFMTSINTVLTGLQKLTTLSKEVQMSMANINIKTPLKHIQDQVHNTTGTIVSETKEMGKSIAKNLDPGKTKILDTPLKQTKQLNNEVKGVTGNLQDMMKARGRDSVITPRRADAHVIKVPDEDIIKTTAKNVQNMAKEIPHTGIRMFDEKNLEAIKDAPPIDLSKSMVVDYSKDLQKVMKIMDPFDTKKMLPDEKEIKGASKGIAKETEKIAQEPAIRGPVQKTLDDQMIPIKQPVVEHAQEYTKTIQSTLGVQHDLRESTDAVSNSYAMNMKNAIAHGQILDQNVGKGLAVKTMFKTMADGSVQASHRMVDANRNTLASMLSLKNMVGKMVHYITFSIGVQMVMKMREAIVSLITTFRDFERSIVNATTVAGNMGGSFEKVAKRLSDVSLLLGRTTVYSAQEVADAFYDLASAGFDVSKMTENDLLPILNYAAATQANLKDATYAVSVTLKAFGLDIKDTERVVDTFTATITNSFMTFEKLQEAMRHVAPIAGTLKMELEEVSSALALLTDRGYTGSQAGQRLNMILTRLLQPTEQAEKRLREMGLTLQDIDPEVHSLETILQRLKAANFGVADAAIMFRARTAAAAAVLVDSVDSIGKYTMMLKGAGGITEQVAKAQIDTLYGSLKLLRDAFAETGIAMGEKLAPHIRVLADFIQNSFLPVIVKLGDFLQTYWGIISKVITAWIVWKSVLIASQVALGAYNTILAFKIALQKLEISNERILMKVFGKKMAATMILNKQLKAEMATRTAAIAAQQAQSKATLTQTTLFNFQSIAAKKAAASNIALAGSLKIAAAAGLMLKTVLLPLLLITGAVIGIMAIINHLNKDFGNLGDVVDKAGVNMHYMSTQLNSVEMALWMASQSNQSFSKSLTNLIDNYDYWNEESSASRKELDALSKHFSKLGAESTKSVLGINSVAFAMGGLTGILLGRKTFYAAGVGMEKMAEGSGKVSSSIYSLGGKLFKFLGGLTDDVTKAQIEGAASFSGILSGLNEEQQTIIKNIIYRGDLARITHLLISDQSLLRININRLSDAQDKYKNSLEKVNQMKKDGITNTKEYADAMEDLIGAQNNLEFANRGLLNSIGGILQNIRKYSEYMDDAIGYLEEYYHNQRRINDISRDSINLEQRKNELVESYAGALSKYGANSKEVLAIEVNLEKSTSDLVDSKEELSRVELAAEESLRAWNQMMSDTGYTIEKTYKQLIDMGWSYQQIEKSVGPVTAALMVKTENQDKAYKITMKATDAEKELMHYTERLMDVRGQYTTLLQKELTLTAKLEAYERLLADATKISNENLLRYLETQMKIYKLEIQLYKLRKDKSSQLSDLFNALADQGLINQDMIDGFIEIQKAEGNVIALNKSYADVIGKLNLNQREFINELFNAKKGTSEYETALSNLQNLVGKGIITQSDLNTIIAMYDAQRNLTHVTSQYMDVLGPVMDDLIKQGIISSEVAEIWYNLVNSSKELIKTELDLALAYNELSESMLGVIRNAANLAKALINLDVQADSESGLLKGTRDIFDTYAKGTEHAGKTVIQVLMENLGIWESMGGEIDSVRASFEKFYGMSIEKIFEEMGQAGFLSAIAMIQMGKQFGVWSNEMNEASLAAALGIENIEAFRSQVETAWISGDEASTLSDINNTLGETKSLLEGVFSELTDILNRMMMLQGVDNILEYSLKLDFARIFAEFDNDMIKLMRYAHEQELGFDMSIASYWDEESWKSFIDSLPKDKLSDIQRIIEQYGGEFDINSTWDGKDFQEWYSGLSHTELANVKGLLDSYLAEMRFESVYDDLDYNTWYSNLTGVQRQNVQNAVRDLGGDFRNVSKWDNKDWNEFIGGLGTNYRAVLQNQLDGWNLTFGLYPYIVPPDKPYELDILAKLDDQSLLQKIGKWGSFIFPPLKLLEFLPWATGGIANMNHSVPKLAKGGLANFDNIPKLASGITTTRGPMSAIIGEDGAEAVIPLEGSNRKYGASILSYIIPRYFSDLQFLNRGSYPSIGTNPNNAIATNEYHFYGDFNISGIENGQQLVDKFMEELKIRRRMSV
jgi:TP901 family phage tail tape measure protein